MAAHTDTDDLTHKNTHSGGGKKSLFFPFLLKLAVNMFVSFFFYPFSRFKLDMRELQVPCVISQLFNPRICAPDETQANKWIGEKNKIK